MAEGFLEFANADARLAGLVLRCADSPDLSLLARIYATTREQELRAVPWTDAQKRAFADWQSSLQERHYRTHYPGLEQLIIEKTEDGRTLAIGRIYVDTAEHEVRLLDVTLLPEFRNRGIGTRLMEALVRYVDTLEREATLHVEPYNSAKRLYLRFGFAVEETRGIYEFMRRPRSVDPGVS